MTSKITRRSALALSGLALGSLAAPSLLRAQDLKPIRFGFYPAVDFVGAFLAKDKGIFEKNGIDFQLTPMSATAIVPALVTNSMDIGTLNMIPTLQSIDAGLPISMIAGGQRLPATGNIGLMARAGAGLKEPADLYGRRLATPALNNIMLYMFNYWFKQKGLDPKKLKWIEVPPVNYSDMMKRGEIDAALNFDPFFFLMKEEGVAVPFVNFFENAPDGVVVGGYQANAGWTAKNPEVVAKFRASLVQGSELAMADHDLAYESIAKWTKMDISLVKKMAVPNLSPRVEPTNLDYVFTVMRDQGLLKTGLTADKALTPWT
ncbi:ABC transporter substrate-binding protein [Rhizobium skierniewicense]|uniref:ABC transporter substrate-binding protein n=1 Tax=Rhizobium skierniewicense TaxID=984260 RepID=UPI001FABDEC4|nr:ABC transporter substrate-binding protein [Rhizobium skierniewicense]MCI9868340.1 ABC transporter substrate-binding protein [Rhizobium skierniewicense]